MNDESDKYKQTIVKFLKFNFCTHCYFGFSIMVFIWYLLILNVRYISINNYSKSNLFYLNHDYFEAFSKLFS